jgi:hypothetical protein
MGRNRGIAARSATVETEKPQIRGTICGFAGVASSSVTTAAAVIEVDSDDSDDEPATKKPKTSALAKRATPIVFDNSNDELDAPEKPKTSTPAKDAKLSVADDDEPAAKPETPVPAKTSSSPFSFALQPPPAKKVETAASSAHPTEAPAVATTAAPYARMVARFDIRIECVIKREERYLDVRLPIFVVCLCVGIRMRDCIVAVIYASL